MKYDDMTEEEREEKIAIVYNADQVLVLVEPDQKIKILGSKKELETVLARHNIPGTAPLVLMALEIQRLRAKVKKLKEK